MSFVTDGLTYYVFNHCAMKSYVVLAILNVLCTHNSMLEI